MPSPSVLLASILFGSVGLFLFMYGKRSMAMQPMIIGVALMAYPYFISQTWLLYAIGVALCVAAYFFRD